MKKINPMILLGLVGALPAQTAPTLDTSFQTELPAGMYILEAQPQAANELALKGETYSGIAVQLKNAPQPLELVDPLAPESYGDGEQNVVRDPISGEVVGLKVLSVSF